ncbi:MAG: sulfate ABC transporter permease subunit CysT, partial [Steroidobacteraceae bacterium]
MPGPLAAPAIDYPRRGFRVVPGFGLTLGYTLLYVSLIVLLPLSAAFVRSAELGPEKFWQVVTAPRVLASLR